MSDAPLPPSAPAVSEDVQLSPTRLTLNDFDTDGKVISALVAPEDSVRDAFVSAPQSTPMPTPAELADLEREVIALRSAVTVSYVRLQKVWGTKAHHSALADFDSACRASRAARERLTAARQLAG